MVTTADATDERWDDLQAVFGTRGEPSRCSCQWFRHHRTGFYASTRDDRRAALREQVGEAVAPGVLLYDDEGTPCGWCAVAPRADYERLRTYRPAQVADDTDGVWSVTCFVVRVGHRKRGYAGALLDGAIDLARRNGAAVVEAYPLDASVRTASAAELFHGPLSIFLAAGFGEVGKRASSGRAVVRLTL